MMKTHLKLVTVLFSSTIALFYTASSLAHAAHGTNQPWHACEEKKLNQSCQYELVNKLYIGSCQAANKVLMCVRNQPIIDIKNQHKTQQSAGTNEHAKKNE
ncbi:MULTISPECIES: hypothetical protein [Pseudoalteromonas]|uniref:hypothetical protein n=1 Tax=Pseudoalteromonas TaxID=53246 RepID=UPI0018D1AF30|nr:MULTISPECIES: hypothetical protein [Pseudoalteromonas]